MHKNKTDRNRLDEDTNRKIKIAIEESSKDDLESFNSI